MVNAHAHHIVFKNGRAGLQRAYARLGQKILLKHKIDPFYGAENLVWAPNISGLHSTSRLKGVVKDIWRLDRAGASRERIVRELALHGRDAARFVKP